MVAEHPLVPPGASSIPDEHYDSQPRCGAGGVAA
jgi:hypothetical protein